MILLNHMSKKYLDLNSDVLFSFFKLSDWKERAFMVGGLHLLGVLIYILAIILFFIPIIGWAIAFIILMLLPFLIMVVNFLIDGYKLELIEASRKGHSHKKIPFNNNYMPRIKQGFYVGIANLVYNLPIIIVYFFSIALLFSPVFLLMSSAGTSNETQEVLGVFGVFGSMIVFYILIFAIYIYQLLYSIFIYPVMFLLYSRKNSLREALDIKAVFSFLKNNFLNICLYALITVVVSFVFGFLLSISFFLIFLCIGFVVAPVVFAVGLTYLVHLQAELTAQLDLQSK